MATTVPTMPPVPVDRSDSAAYNAAANLWADALPAYGAAIQTVGEEAESAATAAEADALAAAASATAAAAAALAAGAAVWVSGATYPTTGSTSVVFDPNDYLCYRRIVAGAGTTPPHLDDTNWARTTPSAVPTTVVVTASGTWTCPAHVRRAKFTVTGGGAGSPTNSGRTPLAAAGGGTAIAWRAVVPGTVYTNTVGAGGAAGTGANGNGNAGGTSSVTGSGFTTISATGGGGSLSSESWSSAGVGSGGDINLAGGATSCASVGAVPIPGIGGGSYWGPAGRYGAAGTSYGVGGGGVALGDTTGMAGAAGVIVIEY